MCSPSTSDFYGLARTWSQVYLESPDTINKTHENQYVNRRLSLHPNMPLTSKELGFCFVLFPPGNYFSSHCQITSDLGVSQEYINIYKQCSNIFFSRSRLCNGNIQWQTLYRKSYQENKSHQIVSQPKITSSLNWNYLNEAIQMFAFITSTSLLSISLNSKVKLSEKLQWII